jgi:hypothetical protein
MALSILRCCPRLPRPTSAVIGAPSGSVGDIQTLPGSRTPHGLSGDHHNHAAERGRHPASFPAAPQHSQGNRLERDGWPLHRLGNAAVGVEQMKIILSGC